MNELVIAVGVILLPGLIATIICDKITIHSSVWGSFKYGIYSFVFGVGCYVTLQVASYLFGWLVSNFCPDGAADSESLKVWTIVTRQQVAIEPSEVFLATLFSPVVAAIAAFIVNHKLINRCAQWMSVSSKYGDENLYSFFLNAQEIDWVYLRDFANNLTYQGRVVSFSEVDSMQEIVMSNVTVFTYETSAELYSVPLLYLSKSRGSFVIESIPRNLLEPYDGKEAD